MDFKYSVSGDCIGAEQRWRQRDHLWTTLHRPAEKRWRRVGQREGGRVKIPEVIIREIAVEPCWWMIMWASRERRGS